MLRPWIRPLALALCLLGAGSLAQAQCPTPDGLAVGPCCTTVTPTLPRLQDFTQDAHKICWRDCDVESLFTVTANWRGPGTVLPFAGPAFAPIAACGERFAGLTLTDAAGTVLWRGLLRLLYSRTWVEIEPSGATLQVWRFLVNGDLSATAAAGLSPCPVPPCEAAFGKVRFTGYVDFAEDCGTGVFQHAWMLTHSCDVVDHAPGFPRAGFFHFNRAYTFIGPSAGFAIGPIQPLEAGGTASEAVRRRRLPTPPAFGPTDCEFEEQIDAGLEVQQELCLCGFPTAPLQYAISDLGLGGSCGTSIFTPGGPFLPGFVSMGLGAWTDPTTYPGLETLRWSTGGYDYFDPCTGNTREEVFFGVTTIGGYFASSADFPGFPLQQTFVDQANSIVGGATTMNVPFRSDHILNLNFP